MCDIKPETYNMFSLQPLMAQIQEKSRIIKWIQEDAKRFQNALIDHRITKGRLQEILTMLLTGGYNNLDCLMAYVAYYDIAIIIWYPENHTYATFTPLANLSKMDNIVLKYCGGGGEIKWKKVINMAEFKIDDCVKMKHYIGEGGTALGSESAYKKEELVKMATKLGIECDKIGKKELYDKINMSCYIIK